MEKSEATCQRFDTFLRNAQPGNHLFRGNLFNCKPNVEFKKVTAVEIDCDWRDGIWNRVAVEKSKKQNGEFYLDERCF
ncbi:Hypothetical protein PACV_382 [Pacmanvirus A23]|uniref:Hypothetical protein n=1 Tax=Pacmanvirus A23 TaxID=1932881 RepID=UPI000A093AA0|nr:Hypothetical protein B9W72_gp378 [Pacmanvirus A23]SIP86095.1 Hypothetical protein PACV_382 [Pacmanvirus A23]